MLSYPHWSKLLISHITPWMKILCSYIAVKQGRIAISTNDMTTQSICSLCHLLLLLCNTVQYPDQNLICSTLDVSGIAQCVFNTVTAILRYRLRSITFYYRLALCNLCSAMHSDKEWLKAAGRIRCTAQCSDDFKHVTLNCHSCH